MNCAIISISNDLLLDFLKLDKTRYSICGVQATYWNRAFDIIIGDNNNELYDIKDGDRIPEAIVEYEKITSKVIKIEEKKQ